MTKRTYSIKGERITNIAMKNPSKTTHSYTTQYTVLLDGTLLPKVFLVLNEPGDKFGPRVNLQILEFLKKYTNIAVTCSKSGKMSTNIYKQYLREVIKPHVGQNQFLLVVDSWTGQTNRTIYDDVFKDSEDDKSNCREIIIPPKCTSMCQPLDVYFYRKVKYIIKRTQTNVVLYEQRRELNSREDFIKIHSIIAHQLGSAAFKPMLKYAWFTCGVGDYKPSFQNVRDVCFPREIFKGLCDCLKTVCVYAKRRCALSAFMIYITQALVVDLCKVHNVNSVNNKM